MCRSNVYFLVVDFESSPGSKLTPNYVVDKNISSYSISFRDAKTFGSQSEALAFANKYKIDCQVLSGVM